MLLHNTSLHAGLHDLWTLDNKYTSVQGRLLGVGAWGALYKPQYVGTPRGVGWYTGQNSFLTYSEQPRLFASTAQAFSIYLYCKLSSMSAVVAQGTSTANGFVVAQNAVAARGNFGSHTLSVNKYISLCCVWDGQAFKVYEDGFLKSTTVAGASSYADSALYVGYYVGSFVSNMVAKNLAIWTRGLSESEIRLLAGYDLFNRTFGLPVNPYDKNLRAGVVVSETLSTARTLVRGVTDTVEIEETLDDEGPTHPRTIDIAIVERLSMGETRNGEYDKECNDAVEAVEEVHKTTATTPIDKSVSDSVVVSEQVSRNDLVETVEVSETITVAVGPWVSAELDVVEELVLGVDVQKTPDHTVILRERVTKELIRRIIRGDNTLCTLGIVEYVQFQASATYNEGTDVVLPVPNFGDRMFLDMYTTATRNVSGSLSTQRNKDTFLVHKVVSWSHLTTDERDALETFLVARFGQQIYFLDQEDRLWEVYVLPQTWEWRENGVQGDCGRYYVSFEFIGKLQCV